MASRTDEAHFPGKRGFDEAIESSGVISISKPIPRPNTQRASTSPISSPITPSISSNAHKDQPFFLYLPHFGVHAPHQAKQNSSHKFKDKNHQSATTKTLPTQR